MIKSIDIISPQNYLYFDKKFRIATYFGAFLSVLVVCGIVFCTWTLGKDIIYNKEPSLLIQNKINFIRPEINLNNNTFPISLVIHDMYVGVFDDPDYIVPEVYHVFLNYSDESSVYTKVDIEKCTNNHFPNLEESQLTGITRYYCLKNQNNTIHGYWDEPTLSYLAVYFDYCTNSPTCKTREEIALKSQEMGLSANLYVQDALIDITNFGNPIKYVIRNLFKGIVASGYKNFDIFLQLNQVKTDSGWLFEKFNVVEAYSVSATELDTFAPYENHLFSFILFSSNKEVIYSRKYVKIQNIAANLGGITKFLMIVSYFLNYYFSITYRNVKITNILIKRDKMIEIKKELSEKWQSKKEQSEILESNKLKKVIENTLKDFITETEVKQINKSSIANDENINDDIQDQGKNTFNKFIDNTEINNQDILNSKISISKFKVEAYEKFKKGLAFDLDAQRKTKIDENIEKSLFNSKENINSEQKIESNLKKLKTTNRIKKSLLNSEVNFTNLDLKNELKDLSINNNFENDLLHFSFFETIKIIFLSFAIGNNNLKKKSLVYKKYSKEVENKLDLLTLIQNVADKEVLLKERSLGLL